MQVLQADDDAVCLQLRFAAEMPEPTADADGSVSRSEQEGPSSPGIYPWLSGQPGEQKGEQIFWRYRFDDEVHSLFTGLELQSERSSSSLMRC